MSNYITIGMDLGNEKHAVCALDQAGKVLWRRDVANTPEALRPFFKENAGATVAMETGLCCRWISALAKSCGCEVLVGNARRLAAIWQSKQKNDENDALMLARLARADREQFHPVELRDDDCRAGTPPQPPPGELSSPGPATEERSEFRELAPDGAKPVPKTAYTPSRRLRGIIGAFEPVVEVAARRRISAGTPAQRRNQVRIETR